MSEEKKTKAKTNQVAVPHGVSILYNILVLHGYRQNAARIRKQMSALIKKLKKKINFHFIEAPHPYVRAADEDELSDEELKVYGPYRKWWTTDRTILATQEVYDTQESAVAYVEKHIAESDVKYDAIMGFSQGASVVQMLPSCLSIMKVILVGAVSVKHTKYTKYYQDTIRSLHIMGLEDEVVSHELSSQVATHYTKPVELKHNGKHYVPSNLDTCSQIEKLLES